MGRTSTAKKSAPRDAVSKVAQQRLSSCRRASAGPSRPAPAIVPFFVLLRLSYRSQLAAGSQASFSASGVAIVRGGGGSRCLARMFRTTLAECAL